MKHFLFLLLICGAVIGSAQNICPTPYDGSPCIKDYPTAPTVKTLRSGSLECTIWSQTIAPGSIQIGCCNNTCNGVYTGPLVLNQVYDISTASAYGGIMMSGAGVVSWIFSPQAGSPGKIAFQLVVMTYPTGTPVLEVGIF